jgi:hypothetical protein
MQSILRSVVVVNLCLLFGGLLGEAQQKSAQHKPVVISPTRPKDSRGETVYDEQDAGQPNATVVPGVMTLPELIKGAKPKIPMSSRVHHRKLNIVVEGVVAENGDLIDAVLVKEDADSALAQNALDAFSHYKFNPATLDGKPAAVLLRTEFNYNIF